MILILPTLVYWGTIIILDEQHQFRLFMSNWFRSSLFYVGIIVGAVAKAALPMSEELTESLGDDTASDAFSRGVKDIWK
tara:strand:+ start:2048 stop:2284 length:237 start_codon:yes stop_codon:yes gene_type:complete